MAKQIEYYNNKRQKYEILVDDEILGIGPLNRLCNLHFVVKRNEEIYFHASIQATDEFMSILYRTEANKKKSDYEILLNIGLLKVKIAIEKNIAEDFTYIFNTKNGPPTYELWQQQLTNEYKWASALLVENSRRKYIIIDKIRYYIPNSITRNALGYRKNQFIPKTEKEINEYKSGDNIETIDRVRLVRDKNNPDPVYAILKIPFYEKKHVPSQATLNAIGQSQDRVEVVSTEELNNIPEGRAIDEVRYWDIAPVNERNKQSNKKWWEKTIWQFIMVVGAIASIVALLLIIF